MLSKIERPFFGRPSRNLEPNRLRSLITLVNKIYIIFVPRTSIDERSNTVYAEFRYVHRSFLSGSVSKIQSNLTLRRLMSYIYIYIYIYGAPILDVSRSHTTTQHSR